jgi:hypothetical protein
MTEAVWTRAYSGRAASERSERAAEIPSPRRGAAVAGRVGAARPRRLGLLELVWGGRRWRRDGRAVDGGRTARMERSAEWSGREAEPTPCRIRRRTAATPVRVSGAERSSPAARPRSKGMRTFAPRQGGGGAPRRRNGARSGMEDGRATASAVESAWAFAGTR